MDLDTALFDLLSAGLPERARLFLKGLAWCHVVVSDHGGLLVTLFLAGLVGSAAHCVGMCGPFVLAQTVSRLQSRPARDMSEFHRLGGALLMPYHLGRATTYAGLGAVAGVLAQGLVNVSGLRWISALLLALAAVFFLAYGLKWLVPPVSRPGARGEGWWARNLGARARPLFESPVGWRGYALGLALGFIPCGLVYGALAAAAASGGPLEGAFAMTAFALGTAPALVGVGLAGHVAGREWRGLASKAAPVLMMLNAAVLSYLAWRLVA